MEKEVIERVEKVAVRIFLAGLALVVVGTAALPAIMAILLRWEWLFAYPATLIAILIWVARKRSR